MAKNTKLPPADIEIEIEDPEDVKLRAAGVEIDLMPDVQEITYEHDQNLAETLSTNHLNHISSELLAHIEGDKEARADWVRTYIDGLDVLGLDMEERSEPWEGACGLTHPMLMEAAIRFQSETIMETFPASGPVETKIIGKETQEKTDAAKRVKEDMNFYLLEKMPEYRDEHEKMLLNLGLSGSGFKKIYYDGTLNRPVSMFVPAEDLLIPYGVSNVRSSYRVTHILRKTHNEVLKLQASGFYRDIELPEPTLIMNEVEEKKADKAGLEAIQDERYTIYEVLCELDLDADPTEGDEDEVEDAQYTEEGMDGGDGEGSEEEETPTRPSKGIAKPYVVSIEASSGEILAIRRNWEEGDDTMTPEGYYVGYNYIPGFGAYGFGLIHLVGSFAKGATSVMRQLVDAGTLSNLPGGFKTKGMRVKGDDTPIGPGEFRDVDIASGTLKDNIMTLPYKEPSQVLYALLQMVVDEGRRIGATADIKISDMSANAPVGTTLALLERQLKVMSAVQARVHSAMKEEFKLLKRIIKTTAEDSYEYEPDTDRQTAKASDYDLVEVIPVSDPNAATMSQRIAQLQAVVQLSQAAPQVYDLAQLHRGALEMINIPNAEKIVPLPDDKNKAPRDPVRENMGALIGQPMKAFSYQDHQAHIATHQAFLQDPMNQQVLQGPMGQTIGPALMAHIQEHMAFAYKAQIEAMLGQPLPEGDQPVPPEMERALSAVMAQASQALLQQNMAQAQQMANQAAAQDPVLQQQQRENDLKEAEIIRKQKNDAYDAAVAMERVALERERMEREDVRLQRREDEANQRAQQELRLKAAEILSRNKPNNPPKESS